MAALLSMTSFSLYSFLFLFPQLHTDIINKAKMRYVVKVQSASTTGYSDTAYHNTIALSIWYWQVVWRVQYNSEYW